MSNVMLKFGVTASAASGMSSLSVSQLKTENLSSVPLNAGKSKEISGLLMHLAPKKISKRTNNKFSSNTIQKTQSSLPKRTKSLRKKLKAN
jgi:hypothetical protein